MINMECEIQPDPDSMTMNELSHRLSPMQLNRVVGAAGRSAVYDHLTVKNLATHNAFGATKSNYYGHAAQSTSFYADEDSALITIHQVGMGLHYYGGTVHPGANISEASGKPTKYLTIPACAEAYGHRAADFGDSLELAWGKNGPYALVVKKNTTPSSRLASKQYNKGLAVKAERAQVFGGQLIMYWLVKEATISPDPSVIPTEEEFSNAIEDEMAKYLTVRQEREYLQTIEQQANETP